MSADELGMIESIDYKRVFDANDPGVKNDMYQIIMDYLYKEKMYSTAVIFQDEANMRSNEASAKRCSCRSKLEFYLRFLFFHFYL